MLFFEGFAHGKSLYFMVNVLKLRVDDSDDDDVALMLLLEGEPPPNFEIFVRDPLRATRHDWELLPIMSIEV
jgi:hypothetical protein